MRPWILVALAAIACGRVGFQPIAERDAAPRDGALVDGANAACPATQPGCSTDACATDVSCAYADGTCCTCNGAAWVCLAPNAPECPETKPMIGSACTIADLACGYCETELVVCRDNAWKPGGAPC